MENENNISHNSLAEIKIMVPENLSRAFQRCIWMRINESGKNQLEKMEELVLDFLDKHDC